MALVAQFASAWDSSNRAQFVPAWAEDAAPLVLITEMDTGNVSASLSSVTDPESASPVLWLDRRPDAANWRHFLFAVEGAEGKTPVFRFNLATKWDRETPSADYLPVWTQDFVTWTSAPARSIVGGMTGYLEWQFADPLPAGRVYVASHPLGRQADAVSLAQSLLTTHSAVASPAPSADANGVYATSVAESDASGRPIGGHPMYAIKLAWGGTTTDGKPKRTLVNLAGIHAAGESMSWLTFRAALDWMMFDASTAAQNFRANWDVFLYFNLSPNGVYGGHRRYNSETRTEDPNRDWDGTSVLAEIAATRAALLSDVGQCDAFLSWHTHPYATSRWIPGKNVQNNASPDAIHSAFIAAGNTIFGLTAMNYGSTTANTDAWWAQEALSSKLSFHAEVGTLSGGTVAKYSEVGQNWAKTLQAVDAAGYFAPVTHELSGAAVSISTATGTLITSIQLAGSAASLSTAGGNLTARITLSGAALAQAAATAALTAGAADLAGDAHATAAAIGTLTTQIRLSGAAVSQALAGADLTTESAGLSGSAQASATAMGLLGTGIPLVGEATATASAAGSLGVPILLSGAAAAVSSATGELTIALALAGHSLASALASGSLTTQIRLSGAALGRAAASGALAGTQIETPARRIYRVRYPARIMRVTT